MNDSYSLANALSEPLRQPFWWAALASVGLHGVLGVNAPKISNLIYGGNSSKNLPGSVGLVELTPTEMGRLPQTIPSLKSNGKSPLSIAPVPLPPKLTPPLPPAPTAINLPALPPGMPPPGFFSPLPPSPLPSLTPPTPPTASTPTAAVKGPTVKIPLAIPPQPPANQLFPPPVNFDPIIPPPPPSSPAPELPRFLPGESEETNPDVLRRMIERSAVPGLTSATDIATPKDFQPGGRYSSEPDRDQQNTTPKTPEEIAREAIFDRNNQDLQRRNLSPDREAMLDAGDKYITLFEKFKKAYSDLAMTGPTPVNIPYPKAACSQKLEGKAVFGALVNTQGLVKAEPQAIALTGSSILDDAAQAMINSSLILPAASTHKLYQLTFEFKYDEKVCSGIPVKASPAPTGPQPTLPQLTLPSPVPPVPSPVVQPSRSPAPTAQPKPRTQQSPLPQPKPGTQQSPLPQPKPGTQQSPLPQPKPGARDLILPQPQPAAEESPAPEPQPAPEESPTPQPTASPTTESSPSPSPTASPVAAPSPTTEPSPTASPSAP
ncbi:hypothetical protein CP500_019835 [Tychonema bourrellyi FEM_GT703]|uniref:TonB C-terminal domain-containing protein n=1 Tax=Tychonema bourrellyi FEM_GT703 TaxID=2040638 RepID=A0A2G4EW93_9CYAN|nr:energy transducer TonB [Tychonema bourrellyi]PHX53738.1 hypothetical protein CP500_019835 [Tychonema bourrellyi FEM_GT703]